MNSDMHHLMGLALMILCGTACYGGYTISRHQSRWRSLHGTKVEDQGLKDTIKKEIATWAGAPPIDHFIEMTQLDNATATVYEVMYAAPNNDTCEGIFIKTKLPGNKFQKSHEFGCSKENMKRTLLHNVLDNDKPIFGKREGAAGVEDHHKQEEEKKAGRRRKRHHHH